MAKCRLIQTKFWTDTYIRKLDPDIKLIYLYLLTNIHTNICGIYEIDIDTICFETGLKKDSVSKSINRLSKDMKVYFIDNEWILIKNFIKNQQINPKVKKGIEIAINALPIKIKDRLSIDYDTLCIDFDNINSNFNSNINSNFKLDTLSIDYLEKDIEFKKPTIQEIQKYAKSINKKIDCNLFFDTYEAKGWLISGNPVKDWKACIRKWENKTKFIINNYDKNDPLQDIYRKLGDMSEKERKNTIEDASKLYPDDCVGNAIKKMWSKALN